MKKLFLICVLAVLTSLFGAGEEKTIELTASSLQLTSSYSLKTVTVNGVEFVINQGAKNGYNIDMNKSYGLGKLYNTTPISGLKSIRVNVSSGSNKFNMRTGTTEFPDGNYQTGNSSKLFDAQQGDTYFELSVDALCHFSSIIITYEEQELQRPEATVSFEPPTGSTVEVWSDVNLTLNGDADGIRYTTDGTLPNETNGRDGRTVRLNGTVGSTVTVNVAPFNANDDQMLFGDVSSATYTLVECPRDAATFDFSTTEGLTELGIAAPSSGKSTILDKDEHELVSKAVTLSITDGYSQTSVEHAGNNYPFFHVYGGGTLKFSVMPGYEIERVELKGTLLENLTGDGYSQGTWTGLASEVLLTASGVPNIEAITVHFAKSMSLYILGQVNGYDAVQWDMSRAVEMEGQSGVYKATVFFTGSNTEQKTVDGSELTQQVSYFSFAKALNPSDEQRVGAHSDGDYWLTDPAFVTRDEGHPLDNPGINAFRVIPGVYDMTVDLNKTCLYLKQQEVTVDFLPKSGSELLPGDEIKISSNLPELIGSAAELQYSLDGEKFITGDSFRLPDTEGSLTVYARAAVEGETHYMATFAEATAVYQIATQTQATLADIERKGIQGKRYAVTDDLQVVYVYASDDKTVAWARDLQPSINAVEIPPCDGVMTIDFSKQSGLLQGEWKQNNWVMLDFKDVVTTEFSKIEKASTKNSYIIKGGSLSGIYSDARNYTITVSGNVKLECEESQEEYVPNVYIAANYYSEPWQKSAYSDREYWFMTPKVMEVATHTWSVWYGDGFYVPERAKNEHGQWFNEAGLIGAYSVDFTYNSPVKTLGSEAEGQAYEYLAVTMLAPSGAYGEPRHLGVQPGSSLNTRFVVEPLDLDPNDKTQVVTEAQSMLAQKTVVDVTYCDLMGHVSSLPFSGVNIIITQYSDGMISTRKEICQ